MKQFLSFCFGIALSFQLFAQNSATVENYQIMLSQNGLNSIGAYVPQLPVAEVSVVIRVGAMYENTNQSGLSALLCEIVSNRIQTKLNSGKYPTIRFSAEVSPELTTYKFKTIHSDLQLLLNFIAENLVNLKIDNQDLNVAIEAVNIKHEAYNANPQTEYNRLLDSKIFKYDLDKIDIWSDSLTISKYTVLDVDSFYRMYYSPVASTVVIQSRYQPYSQLSMLENSFRNWQRIDFNPDEYTKMRSIKPLIYTTQNTVFNTPDKAKITLSTLSSGIRNYRRGSYFAFLLNAFLNDKSQEVFNELKAETGTTDLQTFYEPHNFYGTFSISASPVEGKHKETYEFLQKAISNLHRFINDNSVAVAKKKFATEYAAFKKNPAFLNESSKHIFANDADYFETLNDSVQAITTHQFLRTVYTDFCNANFAAIAQIDSSTFETENYNSWFAEIDEKIADEKFTYRQNVYEIEGEQNKQLLNRLTQWLKVNPDMQCQINGIGDRSEYNKFQDASVSAFIDTITTFKKYKPDLLKTGIMRIELLRSLKILQSLAESGIAFERISGTAIPLKSKNNEEQAANRAATITLTRLKNRLPLRDIRIFRK
ncbi:MAG: insulinase family protein [Chitinophagales bacterium]|nr:insulinase family protein [Chitinophagales bacterium]OJV25584.1 MAG: hypothetical protein BGO32_00805 [Bacteroidetes bacterium 37-13]HRN94509.1 insulinase family protein [Chitinophagales bacterium]HRP38176.1 insulinase family protein [Chitinophagales bacterium]